MSRATTADTHVACFSRAIKMELSVPGLLSRDRSEITSGAFHLRVVEQIVGPGVGGALLS
jgi:hypothetical protein